MIGQLAPSHEVKQYKRSYVSKQGEYYYGKEKS
jgi:hypothetical protein